MNATQKDPGIKIIVSNNSVETDQVCECVGKQNAVDIKCGCMVCSAKCAHTCWPLQSIVWKGSSEHCCFCLVLANQ